MHQNMIKHLHMDTEYCLSNNSSTCRWFLSAGSKSFTSMPSIISHQLLKYQRRKIKHVNTFVLMENNEILDLSSTIGQIIWLISMSRLDLSFENFIMRTSETKSYTTWSYWSQESADIC